MTDASLFAYRPEWQSLPRPLVFTNGVFDILHIGHVRLLAHARSLGASLIVGVNSDTSVRMLGKGADRPHIPDFQRAEIIAALKSVTAVAIFHAKQPLELIQDLSPDFYVKGADYARAETEEVKLIKRQGGQVICTYFLPDISTTLIVDRLRS